MFFIKRLIKVHIPLNIDLSLLLELMNEISRMILWPNDKKSTQY